jgi:hypothetical protein
VYKNMTRGIIALVFRCNVTGGHLSLNNEVSGFQWATPHEVKSMADEAFAVRVLDASPASQHQQCGSTTECTSPNRRRYGDIGTC